MELDVLKWIKFSSISCTHDNKGFFYSRFDAPKSLDAGNMAKAGQETDKLENQKVYYHRVGTKQDDDTLVFWNEKQPDWMYDGEVTDDGRYLILSARKDTSITNLIQLVDLQDGRNKSLDGLLEPTPLIEDWVGGFHYIHNKGPLFYFQTNHNAPRSKIIEINIEKPQMENWREVIPQSEKGVIQNSLCSNGKIVALYLENASDKIRIFDFDSRHL